MRQSVAELHAEHPFDSEERWWRYAAGMEEDVAQAAELHVQEDPVAYLDDMLEHDYGRAKAINRSLLVLPPDVTYEEFGREVAIWTSINASLMGDNEELNGVLDSKGVDIKDLEIAQGWVWGNTYRSAGKLVLAQYDLMQSIKKDAVANVDLQEILTSSAKDGVELSEQRLADYELVPIEADRYNNFYDGGRVKDYCGEFDEKVASTMWIDSPIGFALLYKGLPNAMAALAMQGTDEVMLHQLQGVRLVKIDPSKPHYSDERQVKSIGSRGLAPLDWQKTMVDVTEAIPSSLGVEQAGIQAAKNNVWTKKRFPEDKEPHLPLDVAERTYDQTAKRLGYRRRKDDESRNWHKSLIAA